MRGVGSWAMGCRLLIFDGWWIFGCTKCLDMAILDDGWAIGREVIYIHVDGAYVTIIIIATTVKSIR